MAQQSASDLVWDELNVNGEKGTLRRLVELGVLSFEQNENFSMHKGPAVMTYFLDGKPLYFTKEEYARDVLGELVKDRYRFGVAQHKRETPNFSI